MLSSHFRSLCRAFSASGRVEDISSWGVAPGYCIVRRWRTDTRFLAGRLLWENFRKELSPEPRRFGARVRRPVRNDRAAETDGPTMCTIREEDSFQRVRSVAAFTQPMQAAIGCVQQRAFSSNCPTFPGIKKFHIQQIRCPAGNLSLPTSSAVDGAINSSFTARSPTAVQVNKRPAIQTNARCGRQYALLPRLTSI